jgi:hypothetical protein
VRLGHLVRRTLFDLLYQSPMMMTMSVEQLLELLAGKIEVLEENLPPCHFVRHISYVSLPGPPRWVSQPLREISFKPTIYIMGL